jgi:hypothetical protein
MPVDTGKQRQLALQDGPPPPAVRLRAVGDNDQTPAETDSLRSSGAAPRGRLHDKLRVVDFLAGRRSKPVEHDRRIDDELRRLLRRQDALVLVIGLLLLTLAATLTCIYWHYARPFPSTDNAFIAARQIPVPASRHRSA